MTGYGGTVKQYQVLLDTRLLAAVRRHAAAGRGRDHALERQRRRRHPHPGQPGAQRPRHRAPRRGDRPARPGQRRPIACAIEADKLDDIQNVVIATANGMPIYVRQVAKVDRRAPARGSGIVGRGRRGRRRRGHRPDAEVREVAADRRGRRREDGGDRARASAAQGDEDQGLQPADRPGPRHDRTTCCTTWSSAWRWWSPSCSSSWATWPARGSWR